MRANVKPLTHWAIYKQYKMRVTSRSADQVDGIFTTPVGEVTFQYNPITMTIRLSGRMTDQVSGKIPGQLSGLLSVQIIQINEHGWETEKTNL